MSDFDTLLAEQLKDPGFDLPDYFARQLEEFVDSLGQMDETARKKQITEYNNALLDLASTPQHSSKLDFILSSSSFFPLPYGLALITAAMSLVKGQIRLY